MNLIKIKVTINNEESPYTYEGNAREYKELIEYDYNDENFIFDKNIKRIFVVGESVAAYYNINLLQKNLKELVGKKLSSFDCFSTTDEFKVYIYFNSSYFFTESSIKSNKY